MIHPFHDLLVTIDGSDCYLGGTAEIVSDDGVLHCGHVKVTSISPPDFVFPRGYGQSVIAAVERDFERSQPVGPDTREEQRGER